MRTLRPVILLVGVSAAWAAMAQTPERIYREKCSVCHDAGTAQAPRLDDRAAWAARVAQGRAALYRSAIEGKPNTAMAAKGGFAELSDAQTRAAVDHMLRAAGYADLPLAPSAAQIPRPGSASTASMGAGEVAPATDLAISLALAERLRAALGKPDNRIETYEGVVTVRGLGIKVETRAGVATLSGSVHEADLIGRAGEIATAMPGVKQVVNRVISAGMLEWD